MQIVICDHCGARFEAKRSTARYCSDRCRVGAHRGEPRPLGSRWLRKAAEAIGNEVFAPAGVAIDPRRFDVSFGHPMGAQKAGRSGYVGGVTIGEAAIVIFPQHGSPLAALEVLVHEMVHIAVGLEHDHRAPFQKAAAAVGLEPPWTATTAGPRLSEQLKRIAAETGPMPVAFDTASHYGKLVETSGGSFIVASDLIPKWYPPRKARKR